MNTILNNLRTETNINIIRTEPLFESRYVRIDNVFYTKGDSPEIHEYEQIQRIKKIDGVKQEINKIASALVVTEDNKVVLINQYRIPQRRFCIESPAGLSDKPGECIEDTAIREITEETGYTPEKLVYVGKTPCSSGLTTEVIDCYIGLNCKKVSDILELDTAEDIQVLEIPLSDMDEFISAVKARVDITIDSKVDFMYSEYKKMYI